MAEGSTKASERGSAIPMRNIKAIIAMMIATVVFTLGDAAMKLVSGAVPTGQSVFLRCTGSVLLVAIAAIYTGAIQGCSPSTRSAYGLA